MMILEINPHNPQKRFIRRAVEILLNGGVIAYPTDTYYGIGCDLSDKTKASKQTFQLYLFGLQKHQPIRSGHQLRLQDNEAASSRTIYFYSRRLPASAKNHAN